MLLDDVAKRLAAEMYARAKTMCTDDDLREVVATTALFILTHLVVARSIERQEDVEGVVQDVTATMYDSIVQMAVDAIRREGGFLYIKRFAPDLITMPWDGKDLFFDQVNEAHRENGAEGVCSLLRRFGLPNWADRLSS